MDMFHCWLLELHAIQISSTLLAKNKWVTSNMVLAKSCLIFMHMQEEPWNLGSKVWLTDMVLVMCN